MIVSAIMYADDLLLVSPTKLGISKQIKVIEEYGQKHGIRYNPDKTEVCVFNNKKSCTMLDEWQEDLLLCGNKIKEVPKFKYLGVILSSDNTNKEHIKKRRTAAYTALTRMYNLGFNAVEADCFFKAKMFKIYIRPVLLYGLEACCLSKSDARELKKTEGILMKRLLGISQSCHTTELFRALNVSLTKERCESMKINFFKRLQYNTFTKSLIEESLNTKTRNNFIEELESITGPVNGAKHLSGKDLNLIDKLNIVIETSKELAKYENNNNVTIKMLKRLFNLPNHKMKPHLINFCLVPNNSNAYYISY